MFENGKVVKCLPCTRVPRSGAQQFFGCCGFCFFFEVGFRGFVLTIPSTEEEDPGSLLTPTG